MCALFYDYNVQTPANQRQVCSAWAETDPVLAIALENREVHFFSDEGEKVSGAPIYSRAADIVTTAWQPRGGALAVGWSDGMISLWVYKENTSREVNSPHTSRISLLKWAPSGNRLISADENGVLAVWKVDNRSQLSLATTYNRQGTITHCVFATAALRDKQQKSNDPAHFMQHVCPSYFFGGEIGSVHYADDLGHISDVQVLNHAIDSMMFYEKQNRLIVITRALQLIVFQISPTDGTVKPTVKFKLSVAGDGSLRDTKWAGPGLLAIASGEPLIRFWDLHAEENSVLSLPKPSVGVTTYQVNNIGFSPRRRILVAGTTQGNVFFWRCTTIVVSNATASNTSLKGNNSTDTTAPTLSYRWDLIFATDTKRHITRIGWSNAFSTLYVNTTEGVVIFHEGSMQRALCGDTAVIQSRPMTLSIEKFRDGTITQSTLDASLRIKGLSHDSQSLVVWNGSKAEVYELNDLERTKRVAQFKCLSMSIVLRGDSIYRTQGNHVEICNMQGVVKNSISFTEAEGKPTLLSVQSKFLAVATDRGLVRVFDLSRRDPKATGVLGNIHDAFVKPAEATAPDSPTATMKQPKQAKQTTKNTKQTSPSPLETKTMRAIVVNADGTRVAILVDQLEGALKIRQPMSTLIVFQSDLNLFQQYEFGVNKYPLSVFFDPQEPRLLACETYKTKPDTLSTAVASSSRNQGTNEEETNHSSRSNAVPDKEITIFFASNEHGLLMQDSFDLDTKYSALLGIHVPRIYLIAHVDGANNEAKDINDPSFSYLRAKIMRDFIGLDKVNDAARQALIDFCYFMTVGNMDEAYRSVKLIENPSVWENMAHMCVKTKRLDVAEVCLGNMGHARGAAAVQEAKKEPQLEVAIAMVAIQLGLLDDAARLYRECGRYDLLNKLYQSSGFWQKSVDIASKRDRMHLKNTHYQLAQHYEAMGNIKEAMEAYEDAGTHQKDIPRMLFKLGKLDLLQKYVTTSKDRDLWIWWAQFQESQGHFDSAIESYERAKDDLSIVRVLCSKKDYQAAAKVVENSGNRAAAYHLGRQFESMEEYSSAIHFYEIGGCYNHTIRLAKEHHMTSELMSFALMSTPSDMLTSAAYFESRGEMEKAVQLYHKGGNVVKAIDLCFSAQLFDELHYLTDELGPTNTTPQLLKRCADFFITNGHYAKAVNLCLLGGRMHEALDICMQHKVKVTEAMAEKMTPPKDDKDTENKVAQKKRTDLLIKLAKCCKQQGAYHLATKKYTQAGEKIKAMKCLLKSGDTEKIVFFANVSRNNEIYILAANYMQTLDWRKDSEISKNIIGFYTKARGMEQLANFYQTCAQSEMEEYRDYEKALGALQEAVKVLSKAKTDKKEQLLATMEHKITLMEQFLAARQQMRESPMETVEILQKLLQEPEIDTAIRVGDAYAMIVDAYHDESEYHKCLEIMEKMKRKGLVLKTYLDAKVLQTVQTKTGKTVGSDDSRRRAQGKPSPRMTDDDDEKYVGGGGNYSTPRRGGGQDAKPRDDDEMEEDIAED